MPYSERLIVGDGILVPTGEIQSLKYPWSDPPLPLNFTSAKTIGEGALKAEQCGAGCVGIDNAFILDRPPYTAPDDAGLTVLKMSSPDTGITMSLRTNQQSLQIYSCVGQNGTIMAKQSQGGVPVEKYGCLVVEPQQWIDGINHPEWGQIDRQVFGPESPPSVLWAAYDFTAE